VLIVDDSILVQKILGDILESQTDIKVIGKASNPYEAREIILKHKPDVITLDIDMPKMNGLTFLKNLKKHNPIPTLIISSLIRKGNEMELRALELGAYDIVQKPEISSQEEFKKSANEIIEKVRAGIYTKPTNKFQFTNIKSKEERKTHKKSEKVVIIGASTGGPESVYRVLKNLPEDYYGVVVVMHMPEGFTESYATRLNISCNMRVKEGEDGEKILRGKVIIAPGNKQLYIKKNKNDEYYVVITDDKPYNHYRPSVDLAFYSAAKYVKDNAIGVIMTGMGKDGANGMEMIYKEGAYTIAQDEKTSVVFGMPKSAIEKKCVREILNPDEIAEKLKSLMSNRGEEK
jgi:two-component system chemotaxis response regulator CheB